MENFTHAHLNCAVALCVSFVNWRIQMGLFVKLQNGKSSDTSFILINEIRKPLHMWWDQAKWVICWKCHYMHYGSKPKQANGGENISFVNLNATSNCSDFLTPRFHDSVIFSSLCQKIPFCRKTHPIYKTQTSCPLEYRKNCKLSSQVLERSLHNIVRELEPSCQSNWYITFWNNVYIQSSSTSG